MVEKWTAADEKLFAELAKRREAMRVEQRETLVSVMNDVFDYDSMTYTINNMITHAAAIHAALEPFVLAAGGNDNG